MLIDSVWWNSQYLPYALLSTDSVWQIHKICLLVFCHLVGYGASVTVINKLDTSKNRKWSTIVLQRVVLLLTCLRNSSRWSACWHTSTTPLNPLPLYLQKYNWRIDSTLEMTSDALTKVGKYNKLNIAGVRRQWNTKESRPIGPNNDVWWH